MTSTLRDRNSELSFDKKGLYKLVKVSRAGHYPELLLTLRSKTRTVPATSSTRLPTRSISSLVPRSNSWLRLVPLRRGQACHGRPSFARAKKILYPSPSQASLPCCILQILADDQVRRLTSCTTGTSSTEASRKLKRSRAHKARVYCIWRLSRVNINTASTS